MTEETFNCIICDGLLTIDTRYPIFESFAPHSGILVKDLLQKITKILFKENENNYLCKSCFSLLEQFDFSEFSLMEIRRQINEQIEQKYGKEYSAFQQFVEVACQTEENLLNISENIKGEIKTEDSPDDSTIFDGKRDRKRGIKYSENSKAFQCSQCTNFYSSKAGLANHVQKKHKSVEDIATKQEPSDVLIKIEVHENEIDTKESPNQDQDNVLELNEHFESLDGESNDSDYEPPKLQSVIPVKRKRGRPSKCSQTIKIKTDAGKPAQNDTNSNDCDGKSEDITIKSEKLSENEDISDFENSSINNAFSQRQQRFKKRRRGRPKKTSESDDIVVKPYIYQCPQCPKKWRTKSELRIHLVSHSDVRAHVCDICGQAYKKRPALDIHIGMHAGINPYTCNICGKVFTQKGALNRHLPIHTGEANYQCDLCGKRFIHHTSFSMHALTHSGLKAYKCEICGLGLMSTSHLKRHMRAHSGEKKYGCSQCGKRFAERYNLAAHERLHFSPGEKRKRTHSCPLCGDTFQRRQKLEEHLVSNHNKILETDESRKWAGAMLNSAVGTTGSGVGSSVGGVLTAADIAQATWPVFPTTVLFPTIKSPPDEGLNDSNEISSS